MARENCASPKIIRKSRESGSQVMEATFVIVPMLLMTFLMLDLSMIVFMRTTMQEAVREGDRFAITGQLLSGYTYQDDSIKAIVQKYALGFLNSTTAAATIHVQFVDPTNGGQGTNAFGNIVNVKVEGYQYKALAPFQRLNYAMYIFATAGDMMEPLSGASPPLRNPTDQ
jgi:Flp pilus assembly protein TadG